MPRGGLLNFFSQQNTAGFSQDKGIPVISQAIAVNVDKDSNMKKPNAIYP